MRKEWLDVKQEIEEEIDAIWKKEPIEVKASSRGLFPSEAGSNGMATGNLFFQIADTYAGGFGSAEKAMEYILGAGTASLDQAKELFVAVYADLAAHMGGKAKNGAAWLNMPKVWSFYQDIVDSFDSIDSKEALASLFWSWKNYIKRLNMWFSLTFTWEVMGNLRCSKQVKDYKKLLDLTLRAEPYMKNAAESKI